jgi:hypothetical protein
MYSKVYKAIALTMLMTLIINCSGFKADTAAPKSKEEIEAARIGKLTGERGMVLFGSGVDEKRATDSINVNAYLWRATLDTVHSMPILSADPFGGTVLTDWYQKTPEANVRYKLNIFITGTELRSDAIRVTAFKQIKAGNGTWREAAINPKVALDVEDKILTRAREMRYNDM